MSYQLLIKVLKIAEAAAVAIMGIKKQCEHLHVQIKKDNTPVTEADLISHSIIHSGLSQLTPTVPIISEEQTVTDFETRQSWQRYWLVDPLDGTKELLGGYDDFSVNIALIESDKPTIGVIVAPVSEISYIAATGIGAYKLAPHEEARIIKISDPHPQPIRAAVSRRHGEKTKKFLSHFDNHEIIAIGSSLKMCAIAEGRADIYPRIGHTCEWDTAAGQCILECAGGQVVDQHGKPLKYNTKDSLLNPNFLALGSGDNAWAQWLGDS